MGLDMANRRRADSGEPMGTGGSGDLDSASICGRQEKTPRLGKDIAEFNEAAAFPDDVEQIAVFSGGGIGPLAGRSLTPMTAA